MKRWVWLGLVGGLVACSKKEPPQTEPQACPGTSEEALPRPVRSQALTAEDGMEDVLITFRPRVSGNALANVDAFANDVKRVGGQVRRRFPNLDLVAARVSPEAREALARNPDVLRVEPDRPVHAMGMPRLPTRALLGAVGAPNTRGSVGEYTQGLKMVQGPQLWDANNDGELDPGAGSGTGITVCVIDSGWDYRHPELEAAVIGQRDFIDGDDLAYDQEVDGMNNTVWGGGHGTHTAGTIGAQLGAGGSVLPQGDTSGVAGVAPTVSLLIARVLDTEGNGRTSDVIAAMGWCQSKGANIASLSLGSPNPLEAERKAFKDADAAGMLSIAATGNSGADKVSFPAAYTDANVVAVGAVGFNGEWASFSQFGPEVALVAPGVSVLSTTIVGAAPFSAIDVGGTAFESNPLEYSGIGNYSGRLVNCGLGDSIASCGAEATCEGFVAYVDRGGGIFFEEKARNAIRAGAKAVIIGNNEDGDGAGTFTLTTPNFNWVPTASVSLQDAATLKGRFGQQVTVNVNGVDYLYQTGTSMATPHVSGVAAAVWSARKDLTAAQLREALVMSAKDLGPAGRDPQYGHGLVQAAAALEYANTKWPLR